MQTMFSLQQECHYTSVCQSPNQINPLLLDGTTNATVENITSAHEGSQGMTVSILLLQNAVFCIFTSREKIILYQICHCAKLSHNILTVRGIS